MLAASRATAPRHSRSNSRVLYETITTEMSGIDLTDASAITCRFQPRRSPHSVITRKARSPFRTAATRPMRAPGPEEHTGHTAGTLPLLTRGAHPGRRTPGRLQDSGNAHQLPSQIKLRRHQGDEIPDATPADEDRG